MKQIERTLTTCSKDKRTISEFEKSSLFLFEFDSNYVLGTTFYPHYWMERRTCQGISEMLCLLDWLSVVKLLYKAFQNEASFFWPLIFISLMSWRQNNFRLDFKTKKFIKLQLIYYKIIARKEPADLAGRREISRLPDFHTFSTIQLNQQHVNNKLKQLNLKIMWTYYIISINAKLFYQVIAPFSHPGLCIIILIFYFFKKIRNNLVYQQRIAQQ